MFFLLVAMALVASTFGGARAAPAPYAPSSVWVLPNPDGDLLVAWAPGTEAADEYRIYGLSSTGLVQINATSGSEFVAEVPDTFVTYAVSGVQDGVESSPTFAVIGKCVQVEVAVPPVVRTGDCRFTVPIDPHSG